MQYGHWFILFRGQENLSLDHARAALVQARGWSVATRQWDYRGHPMQYLVVEEGGHEVAVALNTDPYVRDESAEIAGRYGTGRPDQSDIAEMGHRFEIGFEMREDMDNFNTIVFVQHALHALLHGNCVTFMANVGQFI